MSELGNLYLTTKELAALLRIKERKVYELVANNEVPCSRATGKLLFPRNAIDAWLAQSSAGYQFGPERPRPNVALGSHDPLLDWAIRESGCGLATYYDGSGDGLLRFADGEGVIAGLHLFDADSETWNIAAVKDKCGSLNAVLVEFAWRDRGLMLASSNPLGVEGLGDLADLRFAGRQPGAGADVLLKHQLKNMELTREPAKPVVIARTETEAAAAITSGEADVAFGLRSVAEQHQLHFISITRERFDLMIDRRAWFEPNVQKLLKFLNARDFKDRADAVSGYDCSGCLSIHFNCP